MQVIKRWFTLIELVIVIAIIGILSVILLRTYIRISEMTFRVQQTRNVHQEVLHLSQIIQNFADNNAIDFTQYTKLSLTNGIVDQLHLQGKDGTVSFFLTWACGAVPLSWNLVLSGDCSLAMLSWSTMIQLTDPHKVVLRNLIFKIIPFASQESYLWWSASCDQNDYLHCIHKPWFRMLVDAYSINYGKQWFNHVHIPLQLFF